MKPFAVVLLLAFTAVLTATTAAAQQPSCRDTTVALQHANPGEAARVLDLIARHSPGCPGNVTILRSANGASVIQVRSDSTALAHISRILRHLDVPPTDVRIRLRVLRLDPTQVRRAGLGHGTLFARVPVDSSITLPPTMRVIDPALAGLPGQTLPLDAAFGALLRAGVATSVLDTTLIVPNERPTTISATRRKYAVIAHILPAVHAPGEGMVSYDLTVWRVERPSISASVVETQSAFPARADTPAWFRLAPVAPPGAEAEELFLALSADPAP